MNWNEMNNADEILPGLWLGNYRAAADDNWLRAQGITSVFNCTKTLPFSLVSKKKYRVPVDDSLEVEDINNMTLWAPEVAYKILKDYYAGNRILVHCHAGMQRSAAAIAFVLIVLRYPEGHESIMKYIQSRRPIAFTPGANFLQSIQTFEKYYHGTIEGAKMRMEIPGSTEVRHKGVSEVRYDST